MSTFTSSSSSLPFIIFATLKIWDEEAYFEDVAKCHSKVGKNLLLDVDFVEDIISWCLVKQSMVFLTYYSRSKNSDVVEERWWRGGRKFR